MSLTLGVGSDSLRPLGFTEDQINEAEKASSTAAKDKAPAARGGRGGTTPRRVWSGRAGTWHDRELALLTTPAAPGIWILSSTGRHVRSSGRVVM